MPVTLDATACPAAVVPGTVIYKTDNNQSTGVTLPTSQEFTQGDYAGIASGNLNENFTATDMQGRYGGGAYAVVEGLTPSIGSGLVVDIADGYAQCDGLVEVQSSAGATIASASSRSWIWLSQAGAIVVQDGTTAKPSGNHVLLGSAVSGVSTITSVDTSGVMYLKSGIPWRETADTTKPGDTPDASLRFFNSCPSGLWYWDGSDYRRVPLQSPLISTLLATGESEYIPANYQMQVFDSYTVNGTMTIDGTLRVTT